jgi:hypothetical protein
VKQSRNPVTPGNDRHLAAFGCHLRQQRRLLLGRPLLPPLNPRQDLYICQSHLRLERQEEAPVNASLGYSGRQFYTRLTGHLRRKSQTDSHHSGRQATTIGFLLVLHRSGIPIPDFVSGISTRV